jgi:hypothetical protein
MLFRTTQGILSKQGEKEVTSPDFTNPEFASHLPPYIKWDYSRDLQIDDINIWEVLYEESGRKGIYAAWDPHAEFYMITTGWTMKPNGEYVLNDVESYYGQGAQDMVLKRAKELDYALELKPGYWVDPEDVWIYQTKEIRTPSKLILLP